VTELRAPARVGESGQASVELVALLPIALVVTLAVAQLLAAGAARELAANAATAGAAALVQGGDARAAARDALPGWRQSRVELRVDGRRVRVRLRPRRVLPGLAERLTVTAVADAGPSR
jgi:pilus assembly protein CpaE